MSPSYQVAILVSGVLVAFNMAAKTPEVICAAQKLQRCRRKWDFCYDPYILCFSLLFINVSLAKQLQGL